MQEFNFSKELTLEGARAAIRQFVTERDWHQYHTPRNLVLALTGEVGELAEIFQWKGEVTSAKEFSAKEKTNLEDELSDVLSYLLRIADVCEVDLPAAFLRKLEKNRAKYPEQKCKGRWQYNAHQKVYGLPRDALGGQTQRMTNMPIYHEHKTQRRVSYPSCRGVRVQTRLLWHCARQFGQWGSFLSQLKMQSEWKWWLHLRMASQLSSEYSSRQITQNSLASVTKSASALIAGRRAFSSIKVRSRSECCSMGSTGVGLSLRKLQQASPIPSMTTSSTTPATSRGIRLSATIRNTTWARQSWASLLIFIYILDFDGAGYELSIPLVLVLAVIGRLLEPS